MIEQAWSQQSSSFFPVSLDRENMPGKLPVGVYRIEFDPERGFYLTLLEDSFSMPAKIYGLQRGLIDRVKTSFHAHNTNLGVLLNGLRGTGKTVTCKMLCNELKLPVVLVEKQRDGLPQFLSEISQTVVLFFDEFEKTFEQDRGASLLSVMDGAATNPNKKLFLLTNSERVDGNLLDRPGRIRYRKVFANLDKAQVTEIASDRLHDKSRVEAVVDYVSALDVITVDVVLALCDEVNLFGEDPKVFGSIFNATVRADTYDIKVKQKSGEWKAVEWGVVVSHRRFESHHERQTFVCGGDLRGTVVRVHSPNTADIREDRVTRTIRLTPVRSINRAFVHGPTEGEASLQED